MRHATKLTAHEKRLSRRVRDRDRPCEPYIVPTFLRSTELPYRWTQQLGDVDVTVPVPKGTRGRDLSVVIQKKKLSVGLKGKEPIMSGELCKEIKLDDSTWTLGT